MADYLVKKGVVHQGFTLDVIICHHPPPAGTAVFQIISVYLSFLVHIPNLHVTLRFNWFNSCAGRWQLLSLQGAAETCRGIITLNFLLRWWRQRRQWWWQSAENSGFQSVGDVYKSTENHSQYALLVHFEAMKLCSTVVWGEMRHFMPLKAASINPARVRPWILNMWAT